MIKKQKKTKKKYSDSKLHFIVFLTSKKPINISISKKLVYGSISLILLAILFISAFSYRTYILNKNLNNNLSELENELQKLQADKSMLNNENCNLKDTLDQKTVKIADALSELESLQTSIKEIKEIVGLPVEDGASMTTTTTVQVPVAPPVSRSMNTLRGSSYQEQSTTVIDNEDNLKQVEALIEEAKKELEVLEETAVDRKQYLEDVPTLFPTNGKLTSYFGARWGTTHRGIDISNSIGTKIYAAGNGVVVESKYGYSYGNYILIQHKNGFRTRYAHLSKRLVKVGDEISQGELIGLMGNTGTSYGSHLHFEIYYYGKLIDPLKVDDYLKYKE